MTLIKIGSPSDKYPRKRPDTLVHTEQELREYRQAIEHHGSTLKVSEEAKESMAKQNEERKKNASRRKR